MKDEAKSKQPTVTALVRGLEVMRCFTEARRALGSSDIARLTGLAQPTAWRLCQTLQQHGYLTLDSDNRYRPGLPVLALGFAAIGDLDIADLIRPDLQAIAKKYHAATCLMARERNAMLCVQRYEEPDAALTVSLRVGSIVPMGNSGVGWAYFAGLSLEGRAELIAILKKENTALWREHEPKYLKAMAHYDKNGYVFNDGILYAGLSTVAVPLLRPSDQSVFVISCSTMSAVLSAEKVRREMGAMLKDVATRVSRALVHSAIPRQ